jgi:hypothetical protein
VISGTPTLVSASTAYTVTANWQAFGFDTGSVNVTIYIACNPKVTNWKGGTKGKPTDWNTSSNWDNGVPDANTIAQIGVSNSSASIGAANQPIVGVTGNSPYAA